MDLEAEGSEEFDGKKIAIAVKIDRRVASDISATPVK